MTRRGDGPGGEARVVAGFAPDRRASRGRPSRAGFSLIEALVALAVLALVAGAAAMVFSTGAERGARATARLRATFAAEAILNRVGLDVPLGPGRRAGRLADGAAWAIEIVPYVEAGVQAAGDPAELLAVTVRVTPARARTGPVELKSLRMLGGPL